MKKLIIIITSFVLLSYSVAHADNCSVRINNHLNIESSAKRVYKIIKKELFKKGYVTHASQSFQFTLTLISDKKYSPEAHFQVVDGYMDNNVTKERSNIYGQSDARFYEVAKKKALREAIGELPDCK